MSILTRRPRCAAALITLAIVGAAFGCSDPTLAPTTTSSSTLVSVTLSQTSVTGGTIVTGLVNLDLAAPTGGLVVSLTSSTSTVTVPSSITIAAGATSASFAVNTAAVATAATITASYSGVTQTALLTVTVNVTPGLQGLLLATNVTSGGQPVQATLTLTAPAPSTGLTVSLASSSGLAWVPAAITFPWGATTETFNIGTAGSPTVAVVTITASCQGVVQTASLTIGTVAVSLGGLNQILGGLPLVGTVTLPSAAPAGGAVVALASSTTDAVVPSTVTVPAGAAAQTFTVATVDAPPTTTATITASYQGGSESASIAIVAYPVLTALTCSSLALTGGTSATCTGTLASPAVGGGWQLDLSTDNAAASVPSSLAVQPPASSFQFTIATTTVTAATPVAVQVTDAGSGVALWRAVLTINP